MADTGSGWLRPSGSTAAAPPTEETPGQTATAAPVVADPSKGRRGRRGRWRGRTRTVAVVAVVALVAVAVWRTSARGDQHDYRTALVTRDSAEQTVDLTGTMTAVSQASLAFSVGGEVSTVAVRVGQTVATGQTLATLDASDLQAKVTQDEASVAAAKATLAAHENSPTATGTSGTTGTVDPASDNTSLGRHSAAPSGGSGGHGTSGSGAAARVAQLQAALVQAVIVADKQQQQVDALLSAARATCQAVVTPGTTSGSTKNGSVRATSKVPTAAASGTREPSAAPTVTPTASPSPSPGSGRKAAIKACDDALAAVLAAQERLAKDQAAVAKAEANLATALSELSKSTPTAAPSTGTGSAPSGNGDGGGSGSGGTGQGGQGGGSTTVTPEQLAADQAEIDAAEAQLVEDQQAVKQATLVSPISGTVAAVNVVAGQNVSGSTTRTDVLVVDTGAFEAIGTVSDTTLVKLKVGQAATITPDGTAKPLTGHVVAVGLMPTSSGGYQVTVGFDGHPSGLYAGSGGDMSIVTGSAHDTLTVPSSAVTTIGSRHVVSVLHDGKVSSVQVTLGVVGPQRTQVTSGLVAGDQVVLADLAEPLPANNTFRGFGGGGFGPPGGGGRAPTTGVGAGGR